MNFSKVRKLFSLLIATCVSLTLVTGCNAPTANTTDSGEINRIKKIGIIQIAEHPALDSAREGFIDELKENGFIEGENIEINEYNAQGDPSNLKTMSQRLVQDNSDLILAIATPSAQSIASETSTIPIVVTAVTDPADAEIVESNEKPNTNVTGTSDMTPVAKQFDLINKVYPDTKTVGIMYDSSEQNSELQAQLAIEAADALGYETVIAHVSSTNDVSQVTESIIGKIDVLYVPTDNTIASAIASVVKIVNEKKIPFFFGEEAGVKSGALMTDGLNYYNLGRQTGVMAISILNGESQPQDMPIQYLNNTTLAVNLATAEILGVTIPEDILENAVIYTE